MLLQNYGVVMQAYPYRDDEYPGAAKLTPFD